MKISIFEWVIVYPYTPSLINNIHNLIIIYKIKMKQMVIFFIKIK